MYPPQKRKGTRKGNKKGDGSLDYLEQERGRFSWLSWILILYTIIDIIMAYENSTTHSFYCFNDKPQEYKNMLGVD